MTIKKFIESAIKGGYKSQWVSPKAQIKFSPVDYSNILLDPKAWQVVGKTMGWEEDVNKFPHLTWMKEPQQEWRFRMSRMIDALAEGKSIKEYIKTL